MKGPVRVLFPLIMSLVMALVVTGFIAWLNFGLSAEYPGRWILSFLRAWPVAFVVAFFFGPVAMRLSHRLSAMISPPQV